jgi:hypothetical protein
MELNGCWQGLAPWSGIYYRLSKEDLCHIQPVMCDLTERVVSAVTVFQYPFGGEA